MSAGDCYVVALNGLLAKSGEPGWRLVHGTVENPVDGTRHGHAWIENDHVVIDRSNGHDLTTYRIVYYHLGNVRDVVRYDDQQARRAAMLHEHYGPWDDQPDNIEEVKAA